MQKVLKLQDNELASILLHLSAVRNICAHENRLYCFRTKRPLVNMEAHQALQIPKLSGNEYQYGKRDLFSVLIIFSIILSRNEFLTVLKQINNELRNLILKLKVLTESEILEVMGFPADWREKLAFLKSKR